MNNVTVIGTGNVGSAVAGMLAKAGAGLQILDRDKEKAAALAGQVNGTAGTVGEALTGDVVVLAVPYPALAEIAGIYSGDLDGKTVVDVTNPVDFETFDDLVVPADSSAAAQLASLLPKANVLKAFNTTFAGVVGAGSLGGNDAVVLVAGDDNGAKETLIRLVEAGGLKGVDAGSLKRARELEALAFLQMTLAAKETISWNGGFALVK
ncbi:NADPH-dependent F420 reductase [Raineyella fluvialis]|uniref:Diguanylate cyclase n=1 Tax=Raineyella fluvialis TaxID=2662261 RepID=A0A5Q2FJ98_9ACTN|nr:NADPH-dependent F420 reductase [Raineyella fluvialis]QGF24735.1 diguanylate cyclase [Raineyella fluvialis]